MAYKREKKHCKRIPLFLPIIYFFGLKLYQIYMRERAVSPQGKSTLPQVLGGVWAYLTYPFLGLIYY
jgi:hypothetical protein